MNDFLSIICNRCSRQWNLIIHENSNEIVAFVAICDCGTIFAGNKAKQPISGKDILTNGAFRVIEQRQDLPHLITE